MAEAKTEGNQWKVDLHFHTIFSSDSLITLQQAIKICRRKRIDCIAVTDHNEINGALRLKKAAPFKVIIGEEIKTKEGDIIGLFLKERIPPYLGMSETINLIKSQKGIAYLPHPHKMDKQNILKNISSIDIIEIYNSNYVKTKNYTYAIEIAHKYNKPAAAGSDAHTAFEIGNSYIEISPFEDKDDFLDKLKGAHMQVIFMPLWYRVLTNSYIRKSLRFFLKIWFLRR